LTSPHNRTNLETPGKYKEKKHMETYRKHMENITISYQLIEVHRNNQEVNRTNLEAPGKYKEPMEINHTETYGNI
jgi:hypothetical protein